MVILVFLSFLLVVHALKNLDLSNFRAIADFQPLILVDEFHIYVLVPGLKHALKDENILAFGG